MAKRNGYNVTAFDIDGDVILTEHVTTKVAANKLAREFLTYCNVRTADVDDARCGNCGIILERYIRLGVGTGVCIIDGNVRNIRF